MKEKFLNSSISLITSNYNLSTRELEKIKYGLEGVYINITKFFIIFGIAFLFNSFKETFICIILFNLLRFTGFGFHAEKSYQCSILSIILFVFIPYILCNIRLNIYIIGSISIISIVSYLLFAPSDTCKRPLPNKRKRIIRKVLTVFIGLIYISIIIFSKSSFIKPLFLSALLIEDIMINPLLYKLFKQPYNNYKNYVKA